MVSSFMFMPLFNMKLQISILQWQIYKELLNFEEDFSMFTYKQAEKH